MTTFFQPVSGTQSFLQTLGLAGLGLIGGCGSEQGSTTPPDAQVMEAGVEDRFIPPPPRTNTRPFLNPIANRTVNAGQNLEIQLLANDPDGTSLFYSVDDLRGAHLDERTGAFRWTPTGGQVGRHTFTFSVSDGELEASRMVTITVNPAVMMDAGMGVDAAVMEAGVVESGMADVMTERMNRPPVLAPIGDLAVNEGALLSFRANATDPDGDTITYRSVPVVPAGASFSNGQFSWTPTYRQAGMYAFVVYANDGHGNEVSQPVTIRVNNVPVDLDGDGFRDDVDCNDDNRDVRPLPSSPSVVTITTNTTLCPGTYRRINLVIGADRITVDAAGVILDSASMAMRGEGVDIVDRTGVTLRGLEVRNYTTGINLFRSREVRLEGVSATIPRVATSVRATGISLVSSSGNTIMGGRIRAEGYGLTGVLLRDSSGNTIQGVNFGNGSLELASSHSNRIINNQFPDVTGGVVPKILLSNSNENVIQGNIVRNGYGRGFGGTGGGLTIEGGSNGNTIGGMNREIEGNTFERNWEYTISIISDGMNTLIGNTVRGTRGSGNAVWIRSQARVMGNNINDNDSTGLYVNDHGGSTVLNNDLRRNRDGNDLNCGRGTPPNVCSGNLE